MTNLGLSGMPDLGTLPEFATGAFDGGGNGNGGGRLKRTFSIERLLLIGLLLINGGRWWQAQTNTNEALAEKIDGVVAHLSVDEIQVRSDNLRAEDTYARKDVIQAQLAAISAQLEDLKRDVLKGGIR